MAVKPEVLLMDEPCSALDPIATSKIEKLIQKLKEDYTIVIVTHSMQQAHRVSDYTAYFHLDDLLSMEKLNIFSVTQRRTFMRLPHGTDWLGPKVWVSR